LLFLFVVLGGWPQTKPRIKESRLVRPRMPAPACGPQATPPGHCPSRARRTPDSSIMTPSEAGPFERPFALARTSHWRQSAFGISGLKQTSIATSKVPRSRPVRMPPVTRQSPAGPSRHNSTAERTCWPPHKAAARATGRAQAGRFRPPARRLPLAVSRCVDVQVATVTVTHHPPEQESSPFGLDKPEDSDSPPGHITNPRGFMDY
jgi:hypothetical protein